MFANSYHTNFVKPSDESVLVSNNPTLSGEQARQLYLQEIETSVSIKTKRCDYEKTFQRTRKRKPEPKQLTDKEIFLLAQNNECDTLINVLNQSPDKLNLTDSYGWSLLMIACQANSVEVVKELLKRGINTSIRDKAGNSARSLVIKNKYLELCNILLDHQDKNIDNHITIQNQIIKDKSKEEIMCEVCNDKFTDKHEHLSSTIHNITASKGRKFIASYKIPNSNRGYQIMVKAGWDRNKGLGPDGSGKVYPIKAEQKKDRKGLGNKKNKKTEPNDKKTEIITKRVWSQLNNESKRKEINFRREFY